MEYLYLCRIRKECASLCRSLWETRSESAHGHCLLGFVFKRNSQHSLFFCWRWQFSNSVALLRAPPSGLGGGGGIDCIRRKASCTEPRGPNRDEYMYRATPNIYIYTVYMRMYVWVYVYIYIYIYIYIYYIAKSIGSPLLMKGLTTLVISMITNLNV